MRPPKCLEPSHRRANSLRLQSWLNERAHGATATFCVVALRGTSREHAGGLHELNPGIAQSVSVEVKLCGIRYAQKRRVSASRRCFVRRNDIPKSAMFEMRSAFPGPVTVNWRIYVRW